MAEILRETLVELSSPGVEAAWDAEIRERVEAYECGELQLIPAAEVFARVRKLAE